MKCAPIVLAEHCSGTIAEVTMKCAPIVLAEHYPGTIAEVTMKCAPIVLAEHCPGTIAEENQGGVTACCKLLLHQKEGFIQK